LPYARFIPADVLCLFTSSSEQLISYDHYGLPFQWNSKDATISY